jgi:ComF family protein
VNLFAERLKDVLWPRTCAVSDCGRPSDRLGSYICSRCNETLPWYDEYAKSAFAYLEPISHLINIYKFNNAIHLTADFAEYLETAFRKKYDVSKVDLVVPVPLHSKRLAKRGYNQSGLLAAAFAKRIDRLYDETSLVRLRDTAHQSRLSGDDRRKNLNGVFRVTCPSQVRGRTIVLIDDVMTTGATIEECSNALYDAGAYKVLPFVLAKALMDEDVGEDYLSAGKSKVN